MPPLAPYNLGRKFEQKTGLNPSQDLFFGLLLILTKNWTKSEWRIFSFGLHYSQISFHPHFENPAYASATYRS